MSQMLAVCCATFAATFTAAGFKLMFMRRPGPTITAFAIAAVWVALAWGLVG